MPSAQADPHPPSVRDEGASPQRPDGLARQALQLAMHLLDRAELRQRPDEMSLALTQVARCMKALAALGAAEAYLRQALRWAAMLPAADARVDLLCELAEVVCSRAEAASSDAALDAGERRALRERARDQAFEAATQAAQATDPHWEVTVLLRVSDVLDRCGDHDDAARMQCRALALMGRRQTRTDGDAGAEAVQAPGSGLLM